MLKLNKERRLLASFPEAMEGHFSCAHKDGFRVVTGTCVAPELPQVLRQLAVAMDAAQIQLVRALTSQYMQLEEVQEKKL